MSTYSHQQRRNAILNGVRAANDLHEELGLRDKLKLGNNFVDVFEVINDLDITLIFRPLRGLLGAYLYRNSQAGIIVTDSRPLPQQRFTAAHELGHHRLKHAESVDNEETIAKARQGVADCKLQEIEAEAFAGEFLAPKWLIYYIMKKQGWSKSQLGNPVIAYQLSLRLGISYEATCIAIANTNWLNSAQIEKIQSSQPQESKKIVLKDAKPKSSWSDAFHITFNDKLSTIHASSDDLVILELPEHSSSGYSWTLSIKKDNVEIISDERIVSEDSAYGSPAIRKWIFKGHSIVTIHAEESRNWSSDSQSINQFSVTLDLNGKEQGLARVARR